MAATLIRSFPVGELEFLIVSKSNPEKEQHPTVSIDVTSDLPAPYNTGGQFSILGGGGKVNYQPDEPGALLTHLYPTTTQWVVRSKDHGGHKHAFKHILTAYAICARMRNGQKIDPANYQLRSSASSQALPHPFWQVTLDQPNDFEIVGGGAQPGGDNQLLVASCPGRNSKTTWYAESKDHNGEHDSSTMTAYAIGLRSEWLNNICHVSIQHSPPLAGAPQYHPQANQATYIYVIGGGAEDIYQSNRGNMLTASYPDEQCEMMWDAAGKDAEISDIGTILAWAIGVSGTACANRLPIIKIENGRVIRQPG